MDILIQFLQEYGYVAMFLAMVLENCNIPIPSEVILGFAGYLIATGVFTMHTTVIVACAAGVIGSIFSYWIGEYGGRPVLLKYGKYILFNQHHFDQAERLFQKYGGAAVFFGRLLPGVRTFISFPAGIAKYPMHRFILWTLIGTIPWTVLLVWLGSKLGEHWQDLIQYNHEFLMIVIVMCIVAVIIAGGRYWWRRKKRNGDK